MSEVGVLVADLCGFAALTDARGDAAAADVAIRFAVVARRALGRRVRVIKTMGDAVLAVAASGEAALAAARRLEARVGADPALPPVHVGVAAGPVVWRRGDVFGATVNTAARLAELAGPGEIQTADLPGPAGASDGRRLRPRRPRRVRACGRSSSGSPGPG